MKGYVSVITWLILFFGAFYYPLSSYKLDLKIVGYWSIFMVFVSIFEAMLPFNFDKICEKGCYYYNNNKNYWLEDGKSFKDMICSKMYMELYSDYSLADCKYRKTVDDAGFRFVMVGEMFHGILSFIMSLIVLYGMHSGMDRKKLYLAILIFGVIQLTMITWYVTPALWDMTIEKSENYYKNEKWWWPPFLWNVPWFILPPYMIYLGLTHLLSNPITKNISI